MSAADILFFICIIYTLFVLFKAASRGGSKLLLICFAWLGLVGILTVNGFFNASPPQRPTFPLLVVPIAVAVATLFISKKGRVFISGLNVEVLLLLSLVRIPVEVCLWLLFKEGRVPVEMTFEGRNFDILAGILVPMVWFGVFKSKRSQGWLIKAWNVIGILLLLNIIITAILSVESTFQVFGIDQPNRAILTFPFSYLASFVAPAVLFSHIVMLWKWSKGKLEN